MAKPGVASRQAALNMLNSVVEHGRLLSEIDPQKSGLSALDHADAARARRLAVETLRWSDCADRLLGRYLRKMPPVQIMNILRLSVVEMCQLDAAAHGVVDCAVVLTRNTRRTGSMAGLVNATLRKVATEGAEIWQQLPVPQLPKWLRKQMIADYSKPIVLAMEAAHAGLPPLDLTPKRNDAKALAVLVGGQELPTGSVRLREFGKVSDIPGFAAGDWWVQDAAAALPVQLLAPQPGETVLDLCAAPGGKTMQIAATGAHVTAVDQSETRMARVRENLERTGLKAELVVKNALAFEGGPFDAILLDAPCSATGTIRRHPDLPIAKDSSDFPELFSLQEQMIDHALALLKPDGRLVFCTCSLLPDEGELQIEDAIGRRPGLRVVPPSIPGLESSWINKDGGIRLRPDFWGGNGGMDGFFMAQLRR